MPSLKLKEATTEYDFKNIASSAKLSLGGNSLKIKNKQPSGSTSLEASVGSFTVGYDVNTKNAHIEAKKRIGLGNLTITQRLPHKQLYLVPSPQIKLACKPALFAGSKLKSTTTLHHDFMKPVSKIEQDLVWKSKYKASATMDSASGFQGTSLSLTANFDKRRLNSVGCSWTKSGGPVLKAEAKVNLVKGNNKSAVKTKFDYRVKAKEAKLELTSPAVHGFKATMTSTVKTKQPTKPSFLLGLKWEA